MQTTPSIVIVDDTKFSSAVVERYLKAHGFADIRLADSAIEAINLIKKRPADILLADWLMPGMDGLALTQLVRELDTRRGTFTYVMLLTAKESSDDLNHAFSKGVDDFIGKTMLKTQLLPRIYAAARISSLQNESLKREHQVREKYKRLLGFTRIDPVTQVANKQHLEAQLDRYLAQLRGRSGHVGLLLCRLDAMEELSRKLPRSEQQHLLASIAKRLQDIARPMDEVARTSEDTFAIALYSQSEDFVAQNLIRRVQDQLFIKAYKTSAGYMHLNGTLQFDILDDASPVPTDGDTLLTSAELRLEDLRDSYNVYYWEHDKLAFA